MLKENHEVEKNLETEDFAQLFEASETQKEGAGKGIFAGRIVAVETDDYLIDTGRKSEGRIPKIEAPHGFEFKTGTVVPVASLGRPAGTYSIRRAIRKLQWETLKALSESNSRVESRILRVRGEGLLAGLRVALSGASVEKFKEVPSKLWDASLYPAEIPANEIDIEDPKPLKRWVGQTAWVKIAEIKYGGPVIVSRKKVAEEMREENRKQTLSKAKVGDILNARVKKVTETLVTLGAFGVECHLNQDEASWYPKTNLTRQYKPGEVIKVKIVKVDTEGQKFVVSRKALMSHPADDMVKQFKPGAIVEGEVSRVLSKGGYFVRIAGLKRDAYIPFKEAAQEGELKEGVKVKATVMKVDRESIRVVLSQKRYERAEDSKIMAKYTSQESPYSLGDILSPVDDQED